MMTTIIHHPAKDYTSHDSFFLHRHVKLTLQQLSDFHLAVLCRFLIKHVIAEDLSGKRSERFSCWLLTPQYQRAKILQNYNVPFLLRGRVDYLHKSKRKMFQIIKVTHGLILRHRLLLCKHTHLWINTWPPWKPGVISALYCLLGYCALTHPPSSSPCITLALFVFLSKLQAFWFSAISLLSPAITLPVSFCRPLPPFVYPLASSVFIFLSHSVCLSPVHP